MRFDDTKSQTLNLRVSPKFKEALKEAAAYEQRSMVNMLEVLLSDYYDRNSGLEFSHLALSSSTKGKVPEKHQKQGQ